MLGEKLLTLRLSPTLANTLPHSGGLLNKSDLSLACFSLSLSLSLFLSLFLSHTHTRTHTHTHTHTETHTQTKEPLSSVFWSQWCIAVLNTYVCLFREGSMNGLALMQKGLGGGRLRWRDEERPTRRKGESHRGAEREGDRGRESVLNSHSLPSSLLCLPASFNPLDLLHLFFWGFFSLHPLYPSLSVLFYLHFCFFPPAEMPTVVFS